MPCRKKNEIKGYLLPLALVVACVFVLTNVQPVSAPTDNWSVNWTLVQDGIIHKTYDISVQNLTDANMNVLLSSIFDNTSFNISQLRNVAFYEWKAVPENYTYWYDNENSPIYDNWGVVIRYNQYSKVFEVMKCQWKPCKMWSFQQTVNERTENYGSINIPKLGSKEKWDNFGVLEDNNGTKRFRLEFDVPITASTGGWGSSGRIALGLDGTEYHPWWDSNWDYRAPITLTTHPDNYQIKLVLDKVDNLGSNCLNNFQDLRFTENDDGPELSFWIENYISGDNAVVWVRRVENDLTSGDNVIYVYYGNASAGVAENGENTFIFFEDFSVDLSKWNVTGANPVIDAGRLKIIGASTWNGQGVTSVTTFARPFVMETEAICNAGVSWFVLGYGPQPLSYQGGASGGDIYPDSANSIVDYWNHTGYSWTPNIWHTWGLAIKEVAIAGHTTYYDYFNVSDTASGDTRNNWRISFQSYNATAYCDNIRVRKYAAMEPTASVGAEETAALTKPVLVSPENNYSVQDNILTFTWIAGTGATSHRLVIDNDPNFADGENIYDNVNLGASDTTCTTENELPPDNYWWKVAAVASGVENWSENTWTFEVYIPAIGTPIIYICTIYENAGLVKLEWENAENAATHRVQIDNENTFTSPYEHDNAGLTDNNLTVTLENHRTYWRVRGENGSIVGPWSEVFSFNLELDSGAGKYRMRQVQEDDYSLVIAFGAGIGIVFGLVGAFVVATPPQRQKPVMHHQG